MQQPSIKEKIVPALLVGQKLAASRRRGTSDQKASERMRLNNPMHMDGVLDKVKSALKGKKFKERGGNGVLTVQQVMLMEATGMFPEFVVNTKPVRDMIPCLPKHYKIDLANPQMMIAVEVDGRSHKTATGRALDAKKDAALTALGWRVLRFWNEEVTDNLPKVLETISASIASK